ncbi:MAG: MoaF C-terminal domain-containing protein [Gammaproteobacteria bacterium]|nr:MoaF C-terminal domain-containing protein [Gammaproteobacteria bacterium]
MKVILVGGLILTTACPLNEVKGQMSTDQSSNQDPVPFLQELSLDPAGHELTSDLSGRAVRITYHSGHTLEQHWQTANKILWKAVDGELAGYEQTENYHAFKVAEGIYLITWMEASTVANANTSQIDGPWLTSVVLDFQTMRATASWTGPSPDGQVLHIVDQGSMKNIECDRSASTLTRYQFTQQSRQIPGNKA